VRAIQIKAFGDLAALTLVNVADPVAAPDTAVVRVQSASVNPSDVKNVLGAMHQTTLPRIPGRDYAGVVEVGPAEWQGVSVWGTGGDFGFTRDGTHAERIPVPVASLRRMPSRLSFDEAASIGVTYLAAWCGVVEAANLKKGETLGIIGVGGGVGSAAAHIAARLGARVIGVDRREPPAETGVCNVIEKLIIGAPDGGAAIREATGGRGADVVLDTVGGVVFRSSLSALALRGRLVEISSTGTREVTFDLVDFYHNESRLFGVDTLKRDAVASAVALDGVSAGFEAGDFHPSPIAGSFPLKDAVAAYRRVQQGSPGRVVLHPQE
jgi:NADPH:quinone reductase